MGQSDLTLNLLAELFQADLIPALLANDEIEVLETLPTRLQLVERQTDNVVRARINGIETIVHVEFQIEHRANIPARVLTYNALLRQRYHPMPVRSIVVYLMHDRRRRVPRGIKQRLGDAQVQFAYDVFCVWEQPITLDEVRRQPVLAPLAPLTPGIGPEDVALLPRVLERHVPRDTLGDLLALTYVLATRRFEQDLLQSFLESRIMLESPGYRYIIEKGKVEGEVNARMEALLDLVRARLGRAPRGLKGQLKTLEPDAIKKLFRELARINDPEAMRARLRALGRP